MADTIAAVATGRGGAIAIVRVSGPRAIALCEAIFVARNGASLSAAAGYTIHFGEIRDGGQVVDEVLVSVFRAPHSYTGEDSVEISCHASPWIERRIMELLVEGDARVADAGEFTVRAFLAGKMDLSQAEAVADLIASGNRAQHTVAMGQLRGGMHTALAALRDELVTLASLVELELDFGEEDVSFASRDHLKGLARTIAGELDALAGTFSLGNAIREGVPVAIVGRPNAGKSTLLNALVGEDRAMVSEIEGTTRDRIEERVVMGGVAFRFIDTAGLRATGDVLEQMGIDRAREAATRARIVLLVVTRGGDLSAEAFAVDVAGQIAELGLRDDQRIYVVVNKIDRCPLDAGFDGFAEAPSVAISAKTGENLGALVGWLEGYIDLGAVEAGAAIVSGARHYEALIRAREAIGRVLEGLSGDVSAGVSGDVSEGVSGGLSTDLLAEDIREAIHHIGTITGVVTTDEVLGGIFSKFCIGK